MRRQLCTAGMAAVLGLVVPICIVSAAETTIVVPNAFEETEGDWIIAELISDYRLQMIVAADQFTQLPTGTSLLTHLAYRVDGSVDSPHAYTADHMTLRLSTTDRLPSELSQEFAANTGPVESTGFDGVPSWSTEGVGPDGGPKGFDFGLPVEPPFPFDPSQGNLLVDLTVLGGSSPLMIDFTAPVTDSSRFIWSGENGVNSPLADLSSEFGAVYGGDILGLRFEVVPEPSALLLALLGAAALAVFARHPR